MANQLLSWHKQVTFLLAINASIHIIIRAVERQIFIIMLIVQINYFNRALIAVLMHISFVLCYSYRCRG